MTGTDQAEGEKTAAERCEEKAKRFFSPCICGTTEDYHGDDCPMSAWPELSDLLMAAEQRSAEQMRERCLEYLYDLIDDAEEGRESADLETLLRCLADIRALTIPAPKEPTHGS